VQFASRIEKKFSARILAWLPRVKPLVNAGWKQGSKQGSLLGVQKHFSIFDAELFGGTHP
jgi:hypothetical protein